MTNVPAKKRSQIFIVSSPLYPREEYLPSLSYVKSASKLVTQKPNDMKFVETVIESKDEVESISYENVSSRGSQWQVAGFNEKRLIRTIDWKILPLLFAAYFLQFMDKVILNYANVMGLQRDLGMKGDDCSWAGTAFFLGYGLAEFPQGLLTRFLVSSASSLRLLKELYSNGSLLQRC